ncbi:MAG: sulfatase-like hydrolase/transferase [Terracidiphilus sp.]
MSDLSIQGRFQAADEANAAAAPRLRAHLAALAARAGRIPIAAVVLFYLILPNVASQLSTHVLSALPHGYVNLEVLLIGAVGVFLPRWALFSLLLADSLADCAYSICYTYQFSLGDLLESVHFLGVMPERRLLAGAVALTASVFVSAVLALVRPDPRRRVRAVCALLAPLAILLPADILNGQNSLWHKDVTLLSWRVARSPILVLGVREAFALSTESRSRQAEDAPMPSASARMDSLLESLPRGAIAPNVVLIVVESWGLPLDPRLDEALTAPYADPAIARRYRIAYGAAPFTGLTVPGEARELCHSTMGFGILHLSNQAAQRCLPDQFHARGYESIAIHGYAGEMFYRAAWYRELGFDRAWFGADLKAMGLPRCGGAFPGICDGAIANFIGGTVLSPPQSRPRFVYWVTLNSHLPVPVRPDLPADTVCAAQLALRASEALCSWFRLVRAVHESVSRVAAGALARPTVFLLVGDHAPPFGDPRLRSQFSSTQVPYVMLAPKDATGR